jgi:hypothetical protein
MMPFSYYNRFGNGFRFSSRKSHGLAIYETLRDSMGAAYNTATGGIQQARLYAQAMCLAAAQYELDRAANNQNPMTATELLPVLERDYQIIPPFSATLSERRRVVAARRLTTRGPRTEAVEDALRTLLGDAFIAYEPTATTVLETFPSNPSDIGTFAGAGAQKKLFTIDTSVSITQVPVTVPFTSLAGTGAPIAGEEYTVGPDSRDPNIEKITITSVSGSNLTATFTKPHMPGTVGVRPHPLWISSKRYNRIVVTFAAATDPETRRKINELMKRQLRGVSQWCIVSNEGTFRFGHATRARLNATRLA